MSRSVEVDSFLLDSMTRKTKHATTKRTEFLHLVFEQHKNTKANKEREMKTLTRC